MADAFENDPYSLEAMLAKLSDIPKPKSPFGLYSEVVERYRASAPESVREQGIDLRQVHNLVCPNGQPATELDGKKLFWRTGLVSLFSVDNNDVFSEIAEQHQEAMIGLYGTWSDSEGDPDVEPMYMETRTSSPAFRPETQLAPALVIANRSLLSEFYVDKVLRPYERATIECRKILWKRLKESHEMGSWVGFRPTQAGTYAPIPPKSGFDKMGNYRVNRQTYIAGFSYTDEEIGKASFRDSAGYFDQENWIFLCTAGLHGVRPDSRPNSQQSLAKQKRAARDWMSKVGTHYADQGRKVSSKDVKSVAKEKFKLTSNAVDDVWPEVDFPGKGQRGSIPQEKRVDINEIRSLN